MKKLFIILLSMFVLVGCNQNNSGNNQEAIQTYVEATNRLNSKDMISLKIEGVINIPKSALIEEAIDNNLKANIIVDTKNNLMKANFNVQSQTNDLNQEMLMYMDQKYVYLKMGNQWMKESIVEEDVMPDGFSFKNKDITYDEALEFFNKFKEIAYTKESKNGIEGYTISGKVDIMSLLKEYLNQEANQEQQEQFKEYSKLLETLDLTFSTFVSLDKNSLPTYELAMSTEVLGNKVNIGPLNIKVEEAKEKIVIPQEAKKAKTEDFSYEVSND